MVIHKNNKQNSEITCKSWNLNEHSISFDDQLLRDFAQ